MSINIAENPWTLVHDSIPISSGSSIEVSGLGSPLIICNDNALPWFKRRNNPLPRASFPFRWGDEIRLSHFLPTSSNQGTNERIGFVSSLGVGDTTIEVIQREVVGRLKNDECPEDSISSYVTEWVNWIIHSYQSLAHTKDIKFGEEAFSVLVRRSWESISNQFLQSGSEEALMSLIVLLADDRLLHNMLESISKNPRKVLTRIREDLQVSRIQQLDAACIRNYARRPGRDAAEKAGPRQKLLALNRIENTDTLENRVSAWVMEELSKKAHSYMAENRSHGHTQKMKSVRRTGGRASSWRNEPAMTTLLVDGLPHPVMPNYPLQMNRRYRKVYETYQRLLRDRKVLDDAWEWQRNLWSCAARSILYSRLTERYEESYASSCYVRAEGMRGQWTEPPHAPGPFIIDGREYVVLDSWDIEDPVRWINGEEIFPGASLLGMTGCDLILLCPQTQEAILIWLYYWTGDGKSFFAKQGGCLQAILRFEQEVSRRGLPLWTFRGFIIGSLLGPAATALGFDSRDHNKDTKLVSILVPHRSYSTIDDFDAALDLVMGV